MAGDDRTTISSALANGPLCGRQVREIAVPGNSEVAFAVDIEAVELLPGWSALRAVAEELGRWPVGASAFERTPVGPEVFFEWGRPPAYRPRDLTARARALPFEAALDAFPRDDGYWDTNWEELVRFQLRATERRIGHAPSLEEVLQAGLRPSVTSLEAWLMAWEEAKRPTTIPDPGHHLAWFESFNDDRVALLALPTPTGDDVPLYLNFYEAQSTDRRAALAAVFRGWRQRFGAEVVASWGTMLQFVVRYPPQRLEDAFALAVEQDRVAPSTLPLPGVPIRDHARALLGRRSWFLHSRP